MPPRLGVPVETGHPQTPPLYCIQGIGGRMERLLSGLAAGLAFGTALGGLVKVPSWILLAAAGPLAAACLRRSAPLLWLAILLVGTVLTSPPATSLPVTRQIPLLREVTGRVVGLPEPHRATVSFSLEPLGLEGKLLVYLRTERPAEVPIAPGDLVRLVGEGELPQPGGWADYLARRGIVGIFWAKEMEVIEPGKGSPLRLISAWRMRLVEKIFRCLPRQGAELLAALLLGARGLLPGEAKEAFRTAGVAHLLALSGLHLGILVTTGWWLLGLLRLRPGWRYLVLFPFAWGYVLLGGARISLVRAAIMFSILGLFYLLWEGGWVLKRWYDPVESLAGAAIVVLLLWPWSALDLGFQLSFCATFAILYLWPSWGRSSLRARLPGPVRWMADILATSAFAQAGTLPIVGSTFGYISPYGLIANLLLIPWTTLILWTGLFVLIISPFPWAPAVGGFLHRVVISPYLYAVEGLARLPGAALPVGENFGLWCLCCVLGILLLRACAEEFRES